MRGLTVIRPYIKFAPSIDLFWRFRKFKLDIDDSKRSLRKLKVAAEQCKCTLSSNNNATCSVDSLHEGVDFSYQITR